MQSTKHFIGGFILFVRELLGISRANLANELDMSYQNLWDVERGIRGLSNVKLDQLIEKLNLSPWEFWSKFPQYLKKCEKLKAQHN